jgi:hypothetical protein
VLHSQRRATRHSSSSSSLLSSSLLSTSSTTIARYGEFFSVGAVRRPERVRRRHLRAVVCTADVFVRL